MLLSFIILRFVSYFTNCSNISSKQSNPYRRIFLNKTMHIAYLIDIKIQRFKNLRINDYLQIIFFYKLEMNSSCFIFFSNYSLAHFHLTISVLSFHDISKRYTEFYRRVVAFLILLNLEMRDLVSICSLPSSQILNVLWMKSCWHFCHYFLSLLFYH